MSAPVQDISEYPAPDLSDIVTEDDTPVDNVFSEKQQRLLTSPLLHAWSGPPPREDGLRRPFLAMANVGLFFAYKQPPLVPDALLSVDVEQLPNPFPKEGRSYFAWVHGKTPDVVVEVVSNREGGELSVRLRGYERWSVPYYVVFDPEQLLSTEVLSCFRLVGGAYEEAAEPSFAALGLKLVLWQGEWEGMSAEWLRWALLDGTLIPTQADETQRAEQEKARAEQEKARAEQEKARADALAERLRQAGIDPDS